MHLKKSTLTVGEETPEGMQARSTYTLTSPAEVDLEPVAGETAELPRLNRIQCTCLSLKSAKKSEIFITVFYILPALGEDFAGADRVLEEGVRVEETFPFTTPLWLPVLLFPEPDLWVAW